MTKPHQKATAGLADVLQALSHELREANHQIGERQTYGGQTEPVLFFNSAEIELTTTVTKEANGELQFWVLGAGTHGSHERTIKLTLHVNGPETPLDVGA